LSDVLESFVSPEESDVLDDSEDPLLPVSEEDRSERLRPFFARSVL